MSIFDENQIGKNQFQTIFKEYSSISDWNYRSQHRQKHWSEFQSDLTSPWPFSPDLAKRAAGPLTGSGAWELSPWCYRGQFPRTGQKVVAIKPRKSGVIVLLYVQEFPAIMWDWWKLWDWDRLRLIFSKIWDRDWDWELFSKILRCGTKIQSWEIKIPQNLNSTFLPTPFV